ncbi:alpha/beta fold hydrolase [Simiduia agarivorans]|uniref:Biotin synthesis protein bioH n=1 Tax=Simiduia agarivorans (strain DSM 21679 / JCM 13881 / BCRC 17597 / SA1) TaxID=1117647 RepID=K4KJM5_SIMAS|nr:alpha/beta fold hydrolase [Simiduia agarivorans]AFU99176.1 Biotin synthesis protein bioH [Simiduia agarivorans SA1 = DSM 21679]
MIQLLHRGSSDAPLWLAIHGWGFDHCCWQPLVQSLQAQGADLNLFVVDLPGFGADQIAQASNAGAWIDTALGFLSVWIAQQGRPVNLLGWSLGGQLAIRLALRSEHVDSVVCVATNPQFVQQKNWPCAMDAAVYRQFCDAFSANPEITLKRFAGLVAEGAALNRKALMSFLARSLDAADAGHALSALKELDDRHRLSALSSAHWLLGARDGLVPVALADTFPASIAVEVIEGAGHALPFTHPDRIARVLQAPTEAAG